MTSDLVSATTTLTTPRRERPPYGDQRFEFRAALHSARELHHKSHMATDAVVGALVRARSEPDETARAAAYTAHVEAYAAQHELGQCHRAWLLAKHFIARVPYATVEPRTTTPMWSIRGSVTECLMEVLADAALRPERNTSIYRYTTAQSTVAAGLAAEVEAWLAG